MNQRKAGAALSCISLIINAGITFVYVPLLLFYISDSEYGVYELIGSLIAYLSVMDMGLSATLSRFYVETEVKEGRKGVENLLATSGIIYLLLTFVVVAISVALNLSLDLYFGESFTQSELALAHSMMWVVTANCAIVLPGNWFLAILNANELFVFSKLMATAKYLLQLVCVFAVLALGSGAFGVVVAQTVVNALIVVSYAFYSMRKSPYRPRLHCWNNRLVWQLFSFSFFILLNLIFDQVFWKTGQIFLGAFSGPLSVASYAITCKLITAYMQLSVGVSSVFLPHLTRLSAQSEDMAQINDLFVKVGRIQFVLEFSVFAGFAVVGNQFVVLWAGEAFSDVYICTLILMACILISQTQNLGIFVLQAKNKMGFRAGLYTVMAIADIALTIPAAISYGPLGCAIVSGVVLLIGSVPIMNMYYARVIRIDVKRFYLEIIGLIPSLLLPAVVAAVLAQTIHVSSWFSFAAVAIVYCSIEVGSLWLFGFNSYEKGLVSGVIKKLKDRP